jgi:hypothetical protein
MKFTSFVSGAAAVAAMGMAGAASATTFDITWSGAPYGNSATATGFITVDSTLPTLGFSQNNLPSPDVTAVSITITGASEGNGTFGIDDFAFIRFWTPTPLDLTQELIGQPVSGGTDFYGDTNGQGGDFNLFGNALEGGPSEAPVGFFYFQLATEGGFGDDLQVTSIIASAAPEPAAWTMMLIGFGALGGVLRRRNSTTVSA